MGYSSFHHAQKSFHAKMCFRTGTHPYDDSLTELSGLVHKNVGNDRITVDYGGRNALTRGIDSNASGSQTMAPEGGTISLSLENTKGMVEGDSYHREFLLFKRKKGDMDNEHPAGAYHDEQDGDLNLNVKKFKHGTSSANKSMEHYLNPQCGYELIEDSSEAMVRVTEYESCHMEGESQAGGLGESRYSENGHYKFVAIERLGRSPNANADVEFQQYQRENDHNANNMLPDTSGDRPCQYMFVDEVNKAEPSTSNDTPFARTQQKVFAGDTNNISDGNQVKSVNAVSSSEISRRITVEKAGCGTEHLYEKDTSIDGDEYCHERVDVAMEKSHFLSSQCTLNHVSQENWTEQNLCVKCSEGGQLLVCNAVGCPLVVHEKCLGSSPRFDENGEFYCPFCAYSLAISKYLQAKKNASLARKELGAFICRRTRRSRSNGQNNLEQNEDRCHLYMVHESGNLAEKESDQTNNEGHANRLNDQLKKRQGDGKPMEPIISCPDVNLLDGEEEPDVTPGEKERKELVPECLHVRETDRQDQICADPNSNVDNQMSKNKEVVISLNKTQTNGGIQREVLEQQNSDLVEKPVGAIDIDKDYHHEGHANKVNEQLKKRQGDKQPMEPIISCPDVNSLDREKEPDVTPGEKERKELAPECLHVTETDRQDQICADPNSNGDNQMSTNKEVVVSLNKKQSNGGFQREVLEQQNGDLIEKPVGAVDIDRETSVEGNEENIISNYSRKFRGRERQYVFPALPRTLRRKKVPWTAKEEEMLKEGVQKFSTAGDRTIPWKQILEYGSTIFSHRTTIDLKDKWRNMCKGSSKCK
ncbi:uncharacterized protein LOC105645185 isoform X2 [Jatropha curcas]|uniref:uncharacterized protein LOC105645185 isoform X2 n=1 Tax=Jatropha curcas TaxID=180498 RepID=UPI0005FBB7C7|nr:uncharacterized protein LOC105645185 isoform X2 [Jatropha curcas]